jgi:hypothetical protein
MIVLLMLGALVVLVVLRLALGRRRRARSVVESPLAGFDTGVRSPYRVPRGVRFHKGL